MLDSNTSSLSRYASFCFKWRFWALGMALLFSAASIGAAPTWSHVDIGDGQSASLAFDDHGNPALSYDRPVPQGAFTPAYATNDGRWRMGLGWTTADIGYNPDLVEGFTSLAFLGGTPQIAFTSRDWRDQNASAVLKLARRISGSWDVQTVDSNGWVFQPTELVHEGVTYIGYHDIGRLGTSLAYSSDGESWKITANPDLDSDLIASLDLGVAPGTTGKVKLGFAATKLGQRDGLFFATSDGQTWGKTVRIETQAAIGPRIVFASANKIMISYTVFVGTNGGAVKLATSTDGGVKWTTETIATYTDYPPASAIALDRNGNPLVAISINQDSALASFVYLARRNGASWSLVEADSLAYPDWFGIPRIAYSSDGRAVIAYEHIFVEAGESRSNIRFTWSSEL